MRRPGARLAGAVLAIALGNFLFLQARNAWRNYWLLTDGKVGMAVVTGESWSGHDSVTYKYVVNGVEYTGRGYRNSEEPGKRKVQAGDETAVYISGSRPWLSLLHTPRAVIEGWPVTLIVLVLEALALVTVIRPGSSLALDIDGKRKDEPE